TQQRVLRGEKSFEHPCVLLVQRVQASFDIGLRCLFTEVCFDFGDNISLLIGNVVNEIIPITQHLLSLFLKKYGVSLT
ncbi:MAG: hypothetical protein K2H88_02945, partial [Duncaniella sp.]|nr:hypothetical protein [Duncaniella sp.]